MSKTKQKLPERQHCRNLA